MSRYSADITRQPGVLARVIPDNAAALERARALLGDAEQVRLAGCGSSRHAAGYGAAVLDVVGGRVAGVLDAPGVGVPLRAPGPAELIVVASQSGRTESLVRVAAAARRSGAGVIAVVNDEHGELAQHADVILRCGFWPENVIPATGSVTSTMLLLRALAADVQASAVDQLVNVVARMIDEPWALHSVPSRVVVGGLAGEWVAEEVALKLAEVAGVLASAESVVDHLHGPVAVEAPTLALLDPDDPNSRAIATASSVTTAGPAASYTYPLPRVDDPTLVPIAWVVAGQLIAGAVARLLHADPDDTRGLRKVTMTS